MTTVDEALVEEAPPPTDGELARVSTLALRQRGEEREAIRLTALLRAALERLRQTREIDLPDAMRAVGMAKFELTDGTEIKIEDKLNGTKLTSPEGLSWVEEHGGSSMIKCAVVLEMDRGDVETAREIYQTLRGHPAANRFKRLDIEQSVHASTIAAFARELVAKGDDPPLEILGVNRRVAAIVGARPKTVELTGLASREGT